MMKEKSSLSGTEKINYKESNKKLQYSNIQAGILQQPENAAKN